VQRRRADTLRAATACTPRSRATIEADAGRAGALTWSAEHDALSASLQKKRRADQMDAFNANILLPADVDVDLPGDAQAHASYRVARDATYESKRRRVGQRLRRGVRMSFEGLTVHIEHDVHLSPEIRRVMEQYNMLQVDGPHRTHAECFVVNDTAQPGQRTSWACSLVGGFLVDTMYFTSAGNHGVLLAHDRTIATSKQKVWASDDFRAAHSSIMQVLRDAVRLEDSRWALVQQTGAKQHLGLVTVAEKKAGDDVLHDDNDPRCDDAAWRPTSMPVRSTMTHGDDTVLHTWRRAPTPVRSTRTPSTARPRFCTLAPQRRRSAQRRRCSAHVASRANAGSLHHAAALRGRRSARPVYSTMTPFCTAMTMFCTRGVTHQHRFAPQRRRSALRRRCSAHVASHTNAGSLHNDAVLRAGAPQRLCSALR
jgi:hypothetical protein